LGILFTFFRWNDFFWRKGMSLLKRITKSQSSGGGESASSSTPSKSKAPVRKAPSAPARGDQFKDLKERIQEKLLSELDPSMDAK
jgi:hypothetical protein